MSNCIEREFREQMVYRRDKEFLDFFYKASKLVSRRSGKEDNEKKIKRNKYIEKLI